MTRVLEVFWVFLRLGLTSFGGPVAHLGYFRTELVTRRGWLSEAAYADLVGLCQVLPGPASSQVGMGVGLLRAGGPGLVAAWLGFTLPSSVLMYGFALTIDHLGALHPDHLPLGGWMSGLKVSALAVVALAVWGMARTLTPDAGRRLLAGAVAALVLAFPVPWISPLALLLAGAAGWRWLPASVLPAPVLPASGLPGVDAAGAPRGTVSRRAGAALLAGLAALLALLPLLGAAVPRPEVQLAGRFLQAGALVFGGGHVVLPLLQSALVPHFLDAGRFVAGYGAVQAVPGPLFSVSTYLGAVSRSGLNPGYAALLCTVSLFLPAALMVAGAWPFWSAWRGRPGVRTALAGLNAGVVGLLGAALYTPVFTSAVQPGVRGVAEGALALAALLALGRFRLPPWAVVLACAGVGYAVL